jgi:hypothetical protein
MYALVALAAIELVPATSFAATAGPIDQGIGPRVGFSTDPDQFVFGGQGTFGPIVQDLTFDPSLEFGFGDNTTTVEGNFDLHYHFHIKNSNWMPYAGAGASIVNYSYDNNAPGTDSNRTEGGGSLIVGAGAPTPSGNRFFGEMKFGLGDVPSFKIMVGWNFKM